MKARGTRAFTLSVVEPLELLGKAAYETSALDGCDVVMCSDRGLARRRADDPARSGEQQL